VMNVGIIRQHRAMAIEAIRGELASRRQALTDPLTGLANRRALEERFMETVGGTGDRALFYLDLDGFKQVNDRLGHAAGDRLLQLVAERLLALAGPGATACRLGGDEFLVLAEGMPSADAHTFAARIISSLCVPYEIEAGRLARVGVSVGIAIDREGDAPLARLMSEGDRALYAAKASGGGICRLCDDAQAFASGGMLSEAVRR
jgi:diguanylate cyclase